MTGGRMDTKALAMLGVLSALGAALRPLGAGTAGIETVFFLLVLGGRVYGPGFGFVLGSTTLFASALLTGGIGPWLPFQMLAASWVGLGAGLLPPRCAAGARSRCSPPTAPCPRSLYGFLLNLWFWPFTTGRRHASCRTSPARRSLENLHRFVLFTLATSTWGWDMGRAITNAVAIVVLGPAVLLVLRRSARARRVQRAGVVRLAAVRVGHPLERAAQSLELVGAERRGEVLLDPPEMHRAGAAQRPATLPRDLRVDHPTV